MDLLVIIGVIVFIVLARVLAARISPRPEVQWLVTLLVILFMAIMSTAAIIIYDAVKEILSVPK